jgi:acyl dehydratase
MNTIKPIDFKEIKVGNVYELGKRSLTEQEIISFAKIFDPLPFHLSREEGKKTMFGDLFASGSQIFHVVHKEQWLTRFGHSIICGLGVNNWKFLQPIFPDQEITSKITVWEIKTSKRKTSASVTWYYEFLDKDGAPVQTMEMFILHKMV